MAAPSDFIGSEATQGFLQPLPERLQAPLTSAKPELCSCVKYARLLIPELPVIPTPASLTPNASGSIRNAVLLDYNVPHIAVITQVSAEGFVIAESNFRHCQITTRFISWSDPHIRGFWQPVDNRMTF